MKASNNLIPPCLMEANDRAPHQSSGSERPPLKPLHAKACMTLACAALHAHKHTVQTRARACMYEHALAYDHMRALKHTQA